VNIRVEDFDIAVGFNFARQHLARNSSLDAQGLWPRTVQPEWNAFEVEYDVGCVFNDTGDRRKLVQDAFDLHSRYGRAFD
jgi:hypothetical protein